MSSIYLHIPFCRKKCSYCNFHFSTQFKTQNDFVKAICNEIKIQKDFLPHKNLETIYFGGGTPSVLSPKQLNKIFKTLEEYYNFDELKEVTFEANPDDLTEEYLDYLKNRTLINRLSIGVQSFCDEDLKLMNRTHKNYQTLNVIRQAKNKGFKKFNIDLIYGGPTTDLKKWKENINQFLELDLEHLSSYAFTVEPQTAIAHWIKTKKVAPINDANQLRQYEYMVEVLTKNGFENYEFSNFAKNDAYALHNTNYWQSKPYLGLGPSAHSFNGKKRFWNIANNTKYIQGLAKDKITQESEELTPKDRYNEYLMTGLRTKWGINEKYIQIHFPNIFPVFLHLKKELLLKKQLEQKEDTIYISSEFKFQTDGITAELFYI